MKNWKATLVEFLSAILLALLILCLVPHVARAAGDMPPPSVQATPPAQAAPEPEYNLRVLGCNQAQGVCLVVGIDLARLVASNNANFERAEKAEKDLAQMRDVKGCAKVEVVPPRAKELLKSAPPQAGGKS